MILMLEGADFSKNNIGKIDIPTANVTDIVIEGLSRFEGATSNYTCKASFDDGTSRNVNPSWSILSGSQYASISSTGVLSVVRGSENKDVTIKATYGGKETTVAVNVTYSLVSAETARLLSNYSKSLSDNQKIAVDDFYTGLTTQGIKSKIKTLYIPLLANDVSEVFVNVASNEHENTLPNVTSENYILSGGAISAGATYAKLVNSDLIDAKANNFHILSYASSATDIPFGMYCRTNASTATTLFTTTKNPDNWSFANNSKVGNVSLTQTFNKIYFGVGLIGLCNTTQDNEIYAYDANALRVKQFDCSDMSAKVGEITIGGNQSAFQYQGSSYMYSIGEGLTQSEYIKYKTLCDALVNALK